MTMTMGRAHKENSKGEKCFGDKSSLFSSLNNDYSDFMYEYTTVTVVSSVLTEQDESRPSIDVLQLR